MHWIDWMILGSFVVGLTALAVYTKQYTRSVADFLVANRCAGRYMISISYGASAVGCISFVMKTEIYYNAGFTVGFWGFIFIPLSLFMTLSGYVIYRYRETRVMTMAQYFEIRYSRRFRVMGGILAWISGIINMGIFPAVTARFFMYFCKLPTSFTLPGLDWAVSTFAVIMIIELSIALLLTFLGGMIVVVITDFFQGIFSNIAFLVIMVVLYFQFDWEQVSWALKVVPAENASMLDPFKTGGIKGFNWAFFMMQTIVTLYAFQAWQGAQGYKAAAKNAHEAKMAGIIGTWRGFIQGLLMMMLPICAFTLMHHVDFTEQAQVVQTTINTIENPTIQKQMTVPIALTQMLPVGVLGLFAAAMLAAAISTDDTYMHSWGSIFIQDVILPFRKKGFTPRQHIWLLRSSILFVAVFIFFFSMFFRQNDFIMMFFSVTGAIYTGGAGAAIIFGLYWKRGTTAGAWAGLIVGSTLATGGLVIRTFWVAYLSPMLMGWFPNSRFLVEHAEEFPMNGMQMSFCASILAVCAYVGVSLFQWLVMGKPAFNMQRMLHRGEYAIKGEHAEKVTLPPTGLKAFMPTEEFTKWDKRLYAALMCWSLGWGAFFLIVIFHHFFLGGRLSKDWWLNFWLFKILLTVVLGTGTTVWFLIGGFRDLKCMFNRLRTVKRDVLDDGRVEDHRSLADQVSEKEEPGATKS